MNWGNRHGVPVLLGAVLSLATNFATAETASYNELYAAYCAVALAETKNGSDLNEDRSTSLQTAQLYEQRIARFRTYLAARGFLTGERSSEAQAGISMTARRGRSDGRRCAGAIVRCNSSCAQQRDTDALIKCVSQCRDQNASCNSVARCWKIDNLPF